MVFHILIFFKTKLFSYFQTSIEHKDILQKDYQMILLIDKPRNGLHFPQQRALSVTEHGQLMISLDPLEEKIFEIDFFPILPNDSFSSVIDVTTKKGNVFKVIFKSLL